MDFVRQLHLAKELKKNIRDNLKGYFRKLYKNESTRINAMTNDADAKVNTSKKIIN